MQLGRKIIILILAAGILCFSWFLSGTSGKESQTPEIQTKTEKISQAKETESTNIKEQPPKEQKAEPYKTDIPQIETQEEIKEKSDEENKNSQKEELTCTLSVRCDTVFSHIDNLLPEKKEIIPKDGIIFEERSVSFTKGETVFDVLLRNMKENGIHLEFSKTPIYNGIYIEGINNLYEFDCGPLSGWMYNVNGEFPNYGCSDYILNKNDKIEWVYTCNLGEDVGKTQR